LVRERKWAFIQYAEDGSRGRELFDMEHDPRQYTNLAELPQHRDVVDRLSRKLQEKLRAVRDNDLGRP